MTMYAFLQSREVIPVGRPFVDPGGRQYPANWLALSTSADRTARGIVEVAETARPAGVKVTGFEIVEGDGGLVQAWVTESYSPEEVASLKAAKVAAVHAECRRRVLAKFTLDEVIAAAASEEALSWIAAALGAREALAAAVPDDAAAIDGFNPAEQPGWPD